MSSIICLSLLSALSPFTPEIARIINRHYPWVGVGGIKWLVSGGLPCGFFGFLILVMAMEKGLLSTRLLSWHVLTKLGDMSLPIFLLHQILVRYYQWRFEEGLIIPDWFAYGYYWTFLLLGSYILMELIEQPCRKVVSGLGRAPKSSISQSSASTSHNRWFRMRIIPGVVKNRNTIVALLLFLALLLPAIAYLHSPVIPKNAIDLTSAKNIADHTDPQYRNIIFGKKFILKGAALSNNSDEITLKLVWQSITEQRLPFLVAIHVLDEKGGILSHVDYRQSAKNILVQSGTLWMEKTQIRKEKLRSATDLGIVIYSPDPGSLLSIDAGPRDWQGKRLLINKKTWPPELIKQEYKPGHCLP